MTPQATHSSNDETVENNGTTMSTMLSQLGGDGNEENNSKNENITDTTTNNETPETDYKDYPMKNIPKPDEHDVIFGRGAGTNYHPGNKLWRDMVEARKEDYLNTERFAKPLIAFDINKKWRDLKPPGRFLKLDKETNLWNDVGDARAKTKTAQALREKKWDPGDNNKKKSQASAAEGIQQQPQAVRSNTFQKKIVPIKEASKNNLGNLKKEVKNFLHDPFQNNQGRNNDCNTTAAARPDSLGKFRVSSDCSSIGTIEKSFGSQIKSLFSPDLPPPEPFEDYIFSSDGGSSSNMGGLGQHHDITKFASTWMGNGAAAPNQSIGFGQVQSNFGGQIPHRISFEGNDSLQDKQRQNGNLARPAMMDKRDVSLSHQHRTAPRLKKCALNRDQSETSNRLKKQSFPHLYQKATSSLHVHELPSQQSNPPVVTIAAPLPKSQLQRLSTTEALAEWAIGTQELSCERGNSSGSMISATVTPENSDHFTGDSTDPTSPLPALLQRLSTEEAFDQLEFLDDDVSGEVIFPTTATPMGRNLILPDHDSTKDAPPKHSLLKQTSTRDVMENWANQSSMLVEKAKQVAANVTARSKNNTTPPRRRLKPAVVHEGDRKTTMDAMSLWAKQSMGAFTNQHYPQRQHQDHDWS